VPGRGEEPERTPFGTLEDFLAGDPGAHTVDTLNLSAPPFRVMIEAEGDGESTGSHLTLEIWHPECWTLQVTKDAGGGLFGHGVYTVSEKAKGRFTVYGESGSALEDIVDEIEDSPLTDSVWRMDRRYDLDRQMPTPGNTTQSLLVEYEKSHSINESLVSNGFIPEKAVWIHDGREYWSVVIEADRASIQDRLDEIRSEMDAEIGVQQIVSENRESDGVLDRGILSERQRDVFELARERGYYNWPREVNATELADELGISKATFLEHLRKAEAKLLTSLP
jgi:predicted DNA binding protein